MSVWLASSTAASVAELALSSSTGRPSTVSPRRP